MEQMQLDEVRKGFWQDYKAGLDFATLSGIYNLGTLSDMERRYILTPEKIPFYKNRMLIHLVLFLILAVIIFVYSPDIHVVYDDFMNPTTDDISQDTPYVNDTPLQTLTFATQDAYTQGNVQIQILS
jgi:hypothetical protein